MATNSLALKFKLLGDTSGLTKSTRDAQKKLKSLGLTTDSVSKNMKNALAGIGLGLSIGSVVGYLKTAVAGAEVARQADARVLQVAKSMKLFGGNTEVVTSRLADFADKLELSTGVTAETTKQVEATLLTFGAVGKTADTVGGIFDRATTAALDLAAAGFGTAEGNATQLGKALQDPIKGLTALTKSGVTFTKEEKKKITALVKSNKLTEAQDIILQAIEGQVGGTAAATTLSSVKIANAFGQLSDEIGNVLLPYLDEFSQWLQSPQGQKTLKDVADGVKNLVIEAAKLGKWAVDNKDILLTIGAIIVGLKVSKGVIDSYTTLKTIWEGLAKAGKLIKPPATGTPDVGIPGTDLPTGKTPVPTGKTPVPTGTPKTPTGTKITEGLKGLVSLPMLLAGAATTVVALKAESYKGEKGAQTAIADIKRAQAEYGKYYSSTEFLLATGKKPLTAAQAISAGGSNMSNAGVTNTTINVKIEGAKLTPEQVYALLRRYAQQKGQSGKGRLVDLG